MLRRPESGVEHPLIGLDRYRGRLLLVEDDKPLGLLLTRMLDAEGYSVDLALDGQRGLHLALTQSYDLMVLDRTLPAIDGLDLLARIRARGVTMPVLILSALALPLDRVRGLDAGAEDYLAKPFDKDELLARLRALVRRHSETSAIVALPFGRLLTDSRLLVLNDNEAIPLTERECSFLEVLARRPQQVFSRMDVIDRVFPDTEDEGVVDIYVHRLRRKLGKHTVETVRGVGYRLGQG